MGFLHKLWDDTLAGPAPDSGLGRLRKYSATARPPPPSLEIPEAPNEIHISRAITVIRPSSMASPTPPSSPSSPYSPTTPGGNFKKFTRRKPKWEPTSPSPSTPHSWDSERS
ncbi:dormancy-associated protein homolog 4-like [Andrographis paniculata]|uniref:dormancy-associated protein homolog 4-like n=1 Tax=Andrographis paniculata TaxID=175694 RepID=UPI0021E8C1F9|nr:dormancy-associated protein homolog 4-like [Andrographis paniculata]